MVTSIDGIVPTLDSISSEDRKNSFSKALNYMDLKPGAKITIYQLMLYLSALVPTQELKT